jgi:hypothetical protein
MRRRTLLRGVGTGVGVVAGGTVGLASGADDVTPYSPLGYAEVPKAAGAVVGADDETVYVAAGDGFATIDVSDPSEPAVLARVDGVGADQDGGPLQNILDVKVSGNRLLVTGPAQRGPLSGLVVYDVTDPANPTPDTWFRRTGYTIHNAFLDGDYAYVVGPRGAPFVVFDVSSRVPEEVSRWSPLDAERPDVEGWAGRDELGPNESLHDLYVHDGIAYCAYWDAGIWMVDVSDPGDPSYVGHAGNYSLSSLDGLSEADRTRRFEEAPGNAHSVTVDEDASLMAVGAEAWDDPATVGGGPGGIDLWDVSDPGSPDRLATVEPEAAPDLTREGTWTTAHNVDLADDRLYSSWYEAGVKVHDVSDPAAPELLAWWRDPDETSFFTAEAGVPGEFYVASTYHVRSRRPGLYVFPDRAGEQSNPPEPFATSEKWDPTGTGSTTAAPGTPTPPTSPPATTGDGGKGMAGFGIGVALAGLGAGAYRYVTRGGEE